jgi:glutamine synthetase
MIDLKFSDLHGRWHHVTVSAREFNAQLLRDGVGVDGSAVGLKSVKAGDMVLRPDLTTAFRDPFWEAPTLSFTCSAYEADTKLPFTRDPRELGFSPIDQNIFAWNAEQRKTIKPLPTSLFESLRALENDHEFLLQGAVFDAGQIMEWIRVKMDEYDNVQNRPHPIEIALYFDT